MAHNQSPDLFVNFAWVDKIDHALVERIDINIGPEIYPLYNNRICIYQKLVPENNPEDDISDDLPTVNNQ